MGQLRYDKANEWLAARMLVDRRTDCQVLAVEAVMAAVTTQINHKVSYLGACRLSLFPSINDCDSLEAGFHTRL